MDDDGSDRHTGYNLNDYYIEKKKNEEKQTVKDLSPVYNQSACHIWTMYITHTPNHIISIAQLTEPLRSQIERSPWGSDLLLVLCLWELLDIFLY